MADLNFGKKALAPEAKETDKDSSEGQGPELIASFTSHPVINFCVGKHRFNLGVLRFYKGQEDDKENFEDLLSQLPPRDKHLIKQVSGERAAEVEEVVSESQGKSIAGTSTSEDGK